MKKRRNWQERTPVIDLNTVVYGKVPPQAKELEEMILGAIMLEKDAIYTVSEILRQPECFYVDAHQKIFQCCKALAERSVIPDISMVVQELHKREELELVGGPYYVTRLTNAVASSANIEAHAKIVLEKFLQRELIRISGEIMSTAYEDSADVFDLLDDAENKLFKITTGHLKSDYESTATLSVKSIGKAERLMNNRGDLTGVTTGYPALDNITCGWQATDLIIIAARPSVGKTAFALNLARNAAFHPNPAKIVPVGIFSLEMGSSQLMDRLISRQSRINLEKITRGIRTPEDFEQFTRGAQQVAAAPIYIDDTAALNIFEFRAKARRMVSKHKVGLIILDYLQLMSGSDDNRTTNREQEIAKISRNLKALAKELNIPIIALSQLSRDIEKRKDGEPQLSDLRESGAIEQDADFVGFLTRPDYQQTAGVDPTITNLADLHIKKHRNGVLEKLSFYTALNIQAWFDKDQYEEYQRLGGGSWKKVELSREPARDFTASKKDFDDGFNADEEPF